MDKAYLILANGAIFEGKAIGKTGSTIGEIVFTTGGAEALNNVILGTVNPGEEIIILSPAFVSYKNLVKMAGGVCVGGDL